MPGRPYSERFLLHVNSGFSPVYAVSAGRRAVIRCITVMNSSGATQTVSVLALGTTIWTGSVPAGTTQAISMNGVPVYGGESMQSWASANGVVVTISGYLFLDP